MGQGWGINTEWGGLRMYETIRGARPDFFIHTGDTIYADGPVQPEVRLANGTVWKNIVTPAKAKVAETLDEYRGRVVLMVNVATLCGLTPQYEGLQALYEKYKDRGLVVIGFPANT